MGTILIIDDEGAIRRVISRFLDRDGHQTLEASDGRLAMEVLVDQPVDLVITDICMPNQEGLETIRQIRNRHQSLPIFAISGMGERDLYLQMARRFGADQTFPKPIDFEVLRQAIQQALTDSPA